MPDRAAAGDRVRVHVDGRELELSNLDKVLYPEVGFTKGEVIDYYVRVAPTMLTYLHDRPLTRIRYPNGVSRPGFFEKNTPGGTPSWVRRETMPVPGSSTGRETLDFIVADDIATVVWLANLAAIELHTPQWRLAGGGPGASGASMSTSAGASAGDPAAARPDLLVADLDPGPPAGLAECCLVAVAARQRLQVDGLRAAAKTSGRKGMQLLCALPGELTSDEVADFARGVALDLERALPNLVTAKMTKALRPGKVFFDWSQNVAAKTTVTPYSLRAGARPTVSAPVTWSEVESGTVRPLAPDEVLARIDQYGDLLADLLGYPSQ